MDTDTYFIKKEYMIKQTNFIFFSWKPITKLHCVVFNSKDWNWKFVVRLFVKMFSKLVLTSLAIILVSVFSPAITSPLAAVREQAHDANTLANLRGFMSDLKSKLRGELALLMALEEEEEEQGKQILNLWILMKTWLFEIHAFQCNWAWNMHW